MLTLDQLQTGIEWLLERPLCRSEFSLIIERYIEDGSSLFDAVLRRGYVTKKTILADGDSVTAIMFYLCPLLPLVSGPTVWDCLYLMSEREKARR